MNADYQDRKEKNICVDLRKSVSEMNWQSIHIQGGEEK